ncbi:hypothetical protein BDB01DRAFT_848902 [Pilobolus umbonatus]|nr:hypothetical protein BDB01DRAFT_848902 [Pilobolus umbonatus]
MKFISSSRWLIIAVILLQLIISIHAQTTDEPEPTTKPPATTTTPPPPDTTPPPSTTTTPPVTSTTSSAPSTTSTTSRTSSQTNDNKTTTTLSSTDLTSTTSSQTSTPTNKATKPKDDDDSNTPLIVGGVVGGVVGVALIGGILAWINRRGGCAKRSTTKTKADYEDYGLNDFPHHRTQPMAAVPPPMGPIVSPTLPRLNDQGNYYNESNNYGNGAQYAYQDNTMDYGMQPQHNQGYYYPQLQQQEYYDDGNYYYDSNVSNNMSSTVYSSVSPMQHHVPSPTPVHVQPYMMNNTVPPQHMASDIYKPDDTNVASTTVNTTTNTVQP